VGQDGEGYTGDLRLLKIRIFLQRGLDRGFADLPGGQNQPAIFSCFHFPGAGARASRTAGVAISTMPLASITFSRQMLPMTDL
jgi:hypothetical protein